MYITLVKISINLGLKCTVCDRKESSVRGNSWEMLYWMLNRFVKKRNDDKKFSRRDNCGTVTNEKGRKWRTCAVPPKMSYDRLAKFSFRPSLTVSFFAGMRVTYVRRNSFDVRYECACSLRSVLRATFMLWKHRSDINR